MFILEKSINLIFFCIFNWFWCVDVKNKIFFLKILYIYIYNKKMDWRKTGWIVNSTIKGI